MRLFLFVLAMFLPVLSEAQTLVLSKDGKTEYVIVLPAEPSAVEQTAAKELQTHLEAATEAVFPVLRENEMIDAKKPRLVVGDSALMPGIYDGKAVTYRLDKASDHLAASKGRLYVRVRCSSQSGNGPAILFGITDAITKQEVVTGSVPVRAIGDWNTFRWYDAGEIPLSKESELWFSAPGKRGNINAAGIERFVITPGTQEPGM